MLAARMWNSSFDYCTAPLAKGPTGRLSLQMKRWRRLDSGVLEPVRKRRDRNLRRYRKPRSARLHQVARIRHSRTASARYTSAAMVASATPWAWAFMIAPPPAVLVAQAQPMRVLAAPSSAAMSATVPLYMPFGPDTLTAMLV